VARHCPECGFVVAEGANYCPKCGAFQGAAEPQQEDATTATYVIDQSFPMTGEKMTIGRSPETSVFLDDVTVSREHATLVRRGGEWFLDDSGSLNGTYVNRQRVDSHRLEDGDELQIGKFKLTFFAR
jgi:pSer/pThr/pTyr-binding forkhead associated (FHA) protein